MGLALQSAKKGIGWVEPNPPVGCVILDFEYNLLGTGYHQKYGADHAEVSALKKIKDKTKLNKARVFVTLEPCHHQGKTPSCAKALSCFPIHSLCYGAEDPFTKGQGLKYLKEKNIQVTKSQDFSQELENLIAPFKFSFLHKQAFVSLKVATSLDGKMALKSGESRWITGQKAREHAHSLRAKHSAVLIGVKTLLQDNPRLNVRLKSYADKENKVVVLDPKGESLPFLPQSKLLKSHPAHHIIVVCSALGNQRHILQKGEALKISTLFLPLKKERHFLDLQNQKSTPLKGIVQRGACFDLDQTGQEIPLSPEVFPSSGPDVKHAFSNQMSIPKLLKTLYQKENIQSVLVEGGGWTLSQFLQQGSAQRLYLYIAPRIIGQGLSWSKGFAVSQLSQSLELNSMECCSLGEDFLLSGFFPKNFP